MRHADFLYDTGIWLKAERLVFVGVIHPPLEGRLLRTQIIGVVSIRCATMTDMTDERLAEIRARVEVAAEGPWVIDGDFLVSNDGAPIADGRYFHEPDYERNLKFIAHARTDISDLLAEIGRLNERIDNLAEEITALRAENHD